MNGAQTFGRGTTEHSGLFPQVAILDRAAPAGVAAPRGLERFLDHMLRIDASDLYVTAESPPVFRTNGVGLKGKQPLTPEAIDAMLAPVLDDAQRAELERTHELNFAISRGEGRFRVNVFRQRGATGLVVRLVRTRIKTIDELGYPATMKSIAMSKRGLVLVVGGTGSGKSTALAAMIDHRNTEEAGHIVTIEDPIEFLHPHKSSIVTQREIGTDTLSVEAALKNALRQAPDVILIGEIRDAKTMEAAIGFAETGHLCISTLHANNANQAIERVLHFFPADRHHEILLQLSLNLRAVIAQRLVPTKDGRRAAALEILLDTPRVKELVKQGDVGAMKDAMVQSASDGCRTFDGSLLELVAAERVDEDAALSYADAPNDLRLRIERLRASGGRAAESGPALRLLP
jgi:twitching motility protein PilU